MAPTPEQLMIDVQPNLIQAPQVTEQVVPTPVVQEAQVSMPSPQQWIGQIDYGMNWYALGAQAFKVAGEIYPEVLKYDIKKKVAQVNDLQFDYETEMRNSYSESINQPIAPGTSPLVEDFNNPFNKARDFQDRYKKQVNELYNIKDKDGNLQDIFAPEYNLEGLGTYWIDAVEAARSGLRNVAATSEKVQRDLLESFETNYNQQKTYNSWLQGFSVPSDEKTNKIISGITRSISNGTEPVPLEQPVLQEIAKTNPTTASGKPVIIMAKNEDNQLVGFVNKEATPQEVYSAVGEDNYYVIANVEAARENAARGTNLAPNIYNDTVQTLRTANASPAQLATLRARLATMTPEKLEYLFKNAGRDLSAIEQARLAKAWTLSGMNISQRPEMTTANFARELNKVTSADAEMAMAMYRKINLLPSTSAATNITDNNIKQRLEASRQFMVEMLKSSGLSQTELDRKLGNIDSFQLFAQENPQIQPYLISASLAYDTAIRSGVSEPEALKTVKMMYSASAFVDKNGVIVVPRNRGLININDASSQLNNTLLVDGEKLADAKYQAGSGTPYIETDFGYQPLDLSVKAGTDPKFMEAWNKDNAIQRTYKLTTLGNSIVTEQLPEYLASIDANLIPSTSPGEVTLTEEDRLNLLRSFNATEIEDGMHRSENIPAGEAIRVAFASNPAVIKAVLGKTPTSKEEAIKGAALAYELIQPAEYWQWDHQYSAKDDAFINSQNGGIPLGISSIPLVKPIVTVDSQGNKKEITNLLDHRNVVTAPNASFMSLEDPNGRPLTYLPFSFFESTDGLTTEPVRQSYRRLERLSKGRRSRTFQLLTGDSAVGQDANGLTAAGRRLTERFDPTDDNYIALIGEVETPQTIAFLTQPVNTDEAIDAISDPKFLKVVADIAEKTSNKEITREEAYETSLKLMNDPLIRDAIKAKVERTAINGQTTKLNTTVSILQGILGYRYNEQNLMVDPEEVKYSRQFWDIATQERPSIKTNFEWDSKLFDFNYDFSSLGDKNKWKAMGIDVGTLFDEPTPPTPEEIEAEKNRPMYTPKSFRGAGVEPTKQVSPGAVSDKPYMKLIEEFEGLKTEAYWDNTGKVWTIGQGTTTYPSGNKVKRGDKITKEQAREYAETFVNDVVIPRLQETIPTWNEMTPNQQAALISFSYNAGQNFYGREKYKTLSKVLSSVDTFDKVPATLLLYNTSGGQKLKGLVRRRKAEAALWSK